MTSFLFLGGTPSTFKLDVEFLLAERYVESRNRAVAVSWTEQEPYSVVGERLLEEFEKVVESAVCVWCELEVVIEVTGKVQLQIVVHEEEPDLQSLSFSRVTGNGQCDERYVSRGLTELNMSGVVRLTGHDGFPFFVPGTLSSDRWKSLTQLHLISSGIAALPAALGQYTHLRELRLSHNKLTSIPRQIGLLKGLEVFVADHNQLISLPGSLQSPDTTSIEFVMLVADLCDCSKLQDLNLEFNGLTQVVLDLRKFPNLHSLQLYGNPLKFVSELSVCQQLQSLSLMNLRVWSDDSHSQFEVTIEGTTTLSWGTKLNPLFSVLFSRSANQHPLLAGALGRLAEFRQNCNAIMQLPSAPLQQLILMVHSPNSVVQEQITKVIGLMVQSVKTAQMLVKSGVQGAMLSVLDSEREQARCYALKALSALAITSDGIAESIMESKLVQKLRRFMSASTSTALRHSALETLGDLSFPLDNKIKLLSENGLKEQLRTLAHGEPSTIDLRSRLLACRCLAILGESQEVEAIVGRPPIKDRGIRILSIDGGGMKGLSAVKMLKELESRTGRRISDLFDLIGGTSSGAMLAVALGILQFTLDQCDDTYKKLGHRVFNQARQEDPSGWTEGLKRIVRSGQQGLRVVMAGCKHDASTFELLLQEMCQQLSDKAIGSLFIDSAVLPGPKVFAASTLTSLVPAVPFLFRNYELSATQGRSTVIRSCLGSSKFDLWQGVRASSAAPYFFEDFKLDDLHFQDGATTANNPTALAVQQAKLLWPDTPIDCVVSIGLGSVPATQREKSNSSLIDNGSVLIESSCSVERTHEVMSLMASMTPGMQYFRFSPIDKRCDLALDDLDAVKWTQLEAATMDYIHKNQTLFKQAADVLMSDTQQSVQHGSDNRRRNKRERALIIIQAITEQSPNNRLSPLHFLSNSAGSINLATQSLKPYPGYRGNRLLNGLHLKPGPSSEGLNSGGVYLKAVLEEVAGQFGSVHLDLELAEAGEKLVVKRDFSIWSITDPSQEASRLRFVLGIDEEASLTEILATKRQFSHFGSICRLISQQSIYAPSPSSIYIFERSEPTETISTEDLDQLALKLDNVIITSPYHLADCLVNSLLNAGAVAVCCRSSEAVSIADEDTISFFKSFYDYIEAGHEVHVALNQSESILPHLADMYQLYYCRT